MSEPRRSCRPSRLLRLLKRDEGATAVEFGFVGIPFFYLLCVIFETGLMLFTEYTLENGTAQTARLIRTGQAQTGGMSAAEFKTPDMREDRVPRLREQALCRREEIRRL